jgi:hypothetical protein
MALVDQRLGQLDEQVVLRREVVVQRRPTRSREAAAQRPVQPGRPLVPAAGLRPSGTGIPAARPEADSLMSGSDHGQGERADVDELTGSTGPVLVRGPRRS